MGPLIERVTTPHERHRSEAGFSLLEVVVAIPIVAISLLGLAGVLSAGLQTAYGSTWNLIAREKAREAVESVHAARDTGAVTWSQIQNDDEPGGVFLANEQDLKTAGDDGLVGTADDGDIEVLLEPGVDGKLGTTDDKKTVLKDFKRIIEIKALPNDDGEGDNPDLREITVTVKYKVSTLWRSYTLRTFISNVS